MFNFIQIHSFKGVGVLQLILWINNVFQSVQKLFSYSAIRLVGLAESCETSESEPGTSGVVNIPKKPQAAMRSSFKMEV